MDINELLAKGKETVALRVLNEDRAGHNAAHIRVDVVYVQPDKGVYDASLGFYDNYYDQKHKYKGLTVSGQMTPEWELPYGYCLSIAAQGSAIELSVAEQMVNTLKPLHRKMAKIAESEGDVYSFEEYIMRFARVINAKAFYTRDSSNVQHKLNSNIGQLRSHIRHLIAVNQKSLGYSMAS